MDRLLFLSRLHIEGYAQTGYVCDTGYMSPFAPGLGCLDWPPEIRELINACQQE